MALLLYIVVWGYVYAQDPSMSPMPISCIDGLTYLEKSRVYDGYGNVVPCESKKEEV